MKVDLTSSPVVHGELFFHSVFQHFKKDLFIFKEELEPGSYRFSFWVEREEGRLTFFNSCLVLAHKRASHQILKFKGEFLLLSFFEDQRWRLDQCFPCSEAHEAKRLDEGEMTLAASSLIHDSGNRESFNLGTFVRSNYKQWFSYASFLRDKKRTLNVLQLKNQFGQWKLELWPYPTLELPESICGDRPIFKSTLADTSNTYTLFHLKDQSQLALMTCRLNSLREFFQEPQ